MGVGLGKAVEAGTTSGFAVGCGSGVRVEDGVGTAVGVSTDVDVKTGVGEGAGCVVASMPVIGVTVAVDVGLVVGTGSAQPANMSTVPSRTMTRLLLPITCIDISDAASSHI